MHERPNLAAIRGFRAFADLADDDAAVAADYLTVLHLAVGQKLFLQGDRGDSVYLLASGQVEVCADALGEEDYKLATLDPGAVLGEIGLLVDEPRTATVTAMGDVALWELSRKDFLEALHRGDPWAVRFLLSASRDLARRLALMNRQFVELFAETEKPDLKQPGRVAELEQLRKRLFAEWSF